MAVNYVLYGLLFVGMISFVLLILLMSMFGRLIFLQLRIWMIARRGYQQVEVIGEDRVRRYYYMRPKDDHFDVNDGFFLFMPDAITKQTAILQKASKVMAKMKQPSITNDALAKLSDAQRKAYLERYELEKLEMQKYFDAINNLHYRVDAVTLRWGIPTITYVGNSSEPVNFSEMGKTYDAKTLKDLYLRILLTQKYGMFKKLMIIATIALCFIGGILFLYYLLFNGQGHDFNVNMNACITSWNTTQYQLVQCINQSARAAAQNSTIIL